MKQLIIVTGLLIATFHAYAQEFGIEVNGGMQGLQYKVALGSNSIGLGGAVGFNYTFFIAQQWGILAGITAGNYNSKAILQNGVKYGTPQVDETSSAFIYNVQTTDYIETQNFIAAGIPLMLQYHTLGSTQWYANGGAKLLFPFNTSIKASARQLITSGYYPDFNIEVYDMPQHGFGTISNWHSNITQALKPAAALSMATGFSFVMGYANRLYIGIYADYGLNNIAANKTIAVGAAPVSYGITKISNLQALSILNTTNINMAKLFAVGLQIKLGLGVIHFNRQYRCPPSI